MGERKEEMNSGEWRVRNVEVGLRKGRHEWGRQKSCKTLSGKQWDSYCILFQDKLFFEKYCHFTVLLWEFSGALNEFRGLVVPLIFVILGL